MTGQNQPQLPETNDIIANKNKRFLIKENVFLDLFAMVFEEHNLKKKYHNLKKTSMILA